MNLRKKLFLTAAALVLLFGLTVVFAAAVHQTGNGRLTAKPIAGETLTPVADRVFSRQEAESFEALLQKLRSGALLTEQEKREIEWRTALRDARHPHNPLDNQGGPDDFGYIYVDNQGGDTTAYDWVELRGDDNATWVNFTGSHDDAVVTNVPLGLTFPFYGTNYTSVTVSSNGTVQFASSDPNYTNNSLPNAGSGQMGPTIFLYWDDLHLDFGGNGANGDATIACLNFGDYTVIEYDSIGHCCSDGTSLKFEVILYASGNIKLQYNNLVFGASTNSSTIGIQQNGTAGSGFLQYVNNGTPGNQEPANGRAIWFAMPDGVPEPATALTGSANGTTVTLNWTDPAEDTNGNPLTPDSILIYRGGAVPDSQIGHVAHGTQTFSIANERQGNIAYYVRAKAGAYRSAATGVGVIVGTPSYVNFFDVNDGGWTSNGIWTWGAPSNPAVPAPHSGANCWGTGLAANYPAGVCSYVDLDPGMQVASANATIEFWAWWSMYIWSPYDGCNIKVSVDGGDTWDLLTPSTGYGNVIQSPSACLTGENGWSMAGNGWRYVIVPIGAYINQTPIFRISFSSSPFSGNQYPGFFFDDMTIWGMGPRPDGTPRPVTGLHGTANGTTTVTLNWTDPTQDTNGNPLISDSILIYRNNSQPASQIGHVAHGAQTVALAGEPQGNQRYYVRAKAGTRLSTPVNAPVVVGNPSYACSFDTTDGGWIADGVWTWGAPTNAAAPQPHSGANVWGTGLDGNYQSNVCGHLDLSPGQRVSTTSATLEFAAWWSMYPFGSYDGCNVKVSVDSGLTWQPLLPRDGYGSFMYPFNTCIPTDSAWSMTSGGWRNVVLPLGDFLNQTPMFRFTFGTYLSGYPGFFIDDMTIWGLAPRQAIQGTLRHMGGTNPALIGAQVWATGGIDTAVTDAGGNYRLSVEPGTYAVHFRHATHCDSVLTGVVVAAGQNVTENVLLRSPNATLSVSSLTFVVRRFQTVPQTFTITNPGGNCPLSYQVLDSVNWLSSEPASGTVDPNQSATITVTAAPGTMQPNEYHSTMRVLCNAPGSPFILQVDMNVLSVDQLPGLLPTEFALHANYPNPFNPTTLLPFDVPQNSQVAIIVYNVMGQEVAMLVNGKYAAGRYQVSFDAGNLPSGLYLVKMTAGNYTAMNKMMLLK
ncbi:MAG TPA: carboxypeptidase regulatory-like domain-containing protein [bacterium]|jgi:hypothetical protein